MNFLERHELAETCEIKLADYGVETMRELKSLSLDLLKSDVKLKPMHAKRVIDALAADGKGQAAAAADAARAEADAAAAAAKAKADAEARARAQEAKEKQEKEAERQREADAEAARQREADATAAAAAAAAAECGIAGSPGSGLQDCKCEHVIRGPQRAQHRGGDGHTQGIPQAGDTASPR